MRAEDHRRAVGHLVEFLHEHRAACLELVDHEPVVDDLVAHIDRRAEPLERALDDLDRPVDTSAKAARRGNQQRQRQGDPVWEA